MMKNEALLSMKNSICIILNTKVSTTDEGVRNENTLKLLRNACETFSGKKDIPLEIYRKKDYLFLEYLLK